MSFSNIDARKSASCRRRARAVGWLQPRAAAETSGAAARQKGGGERGSVRTFMTVQVMPPALRRAATCSAHLPVAAVSPSGFSSVMPAPPARPLSARPRVRPSVGPPSFLHDCHPLGGSKAGDGLGLDDQRGGRRGTVGGLLAELGDGHVDQHLSPAAQAPAPRARDAGAVPGAPAKGGRGHALVVSSKAFSARRKSSM